MNKSTIIFFLLFLIILFCLGESEFLIPIIAIMIIIFCKGNNNKTTPPIPSTNVFKCSHCNGELKENYKFCIHCGKAVDKTNTISPTNQESVQPPFVSFHNFDQIYSLSDEEALEEFIRRELAKVNLDENAKVMPIDELRKKKIFNIIFSLLIFIYVVMIFFHFPILTYVIGIVVLMIFFKLTRNYNLIKYLKKQIKARPSEKISNIIMSVQTRLVNDTSRKVAYILIPIAIILPMIIFIKPVILYEQMDNGYGVRYYAFGVTNFITATIPETHNNQKVVSLRGNTFSNMPFLKEVVLPDSITEIRGQAFKNDINLNKVKLPNNLTYLGGGAFYNCKSLTHIEIPNTVTYIGGETFYNAISLKSVKLSENITEIRGSTFENCSSLESIEIPNNVTRIGGHAFYGNVSLKNVSISEDSKLEEIGSSAFRRCNSLYDITLPNGVTVNSRAFKESPTEVHEYKNLASTDSPTQTYKYERTLYMAFKEEILINQYWQETELQDTYLTLVRIRKNNNKYEYRFKYRNSEEEGIFTLTKENSYQIINQNLAIELKYDYVFDVFSDPVTLSTYYN